MTTEPAAPAGSVTTWARVGEIFAGSGFRRFFRARMASQFGDGVFQLAAAAVLLFEDPGPNPAMALLGISVVTLVPFSVVAPFAGVFIDRWDRRRILTIVPLFRAALAAALPLLAGSGTEGPAFYVAVLVVLSANRLFLATMSAVLPQLVPVDDLLVANSVSTTGGAVANVVGQAAGTAVAAAIGGTRTAVVAAAGFAVAAVVAARVPVHRGPAPRRGPLGAQMRAVVSEMLEGARRVAGVRRVVYALSAIALVQMLVGALIGALTFYFIAELGLRVNQATVVLGALAVGLGIGVVVVPWLSRWVRHDLLVPIAMVIGATGALWGALALGRTALLGGALVAGISYSFAKIPVDTIVQEEIDDETRGRAFAFYDMLFNVARVAGIAIVAVALEADARVDTLTGGIAGAYVLAAVVFGGWEAAMFKRKRTRPAAPALAAGEMVTVRSYAGGRADEEPRALHLGGHDIAIDEILWRAQVEQEGRRGRVFVVRAAGKRVRLVLWDDEVAWLVERVTDD